VYLVRFGRIPTCVYLSYRPSEPLVPKQQGQQCVSAVYCDKSLQQRINSEVCVKIRENVSVCEWRRRFKEGRDRWPKKWAAKTQRRDAIVGSTNLVAPISKIRCETNSRRKKNSMV
jgi:hypothetical protein